MLLRRPSEVYIDGQRCIRCGVCEQIVPGLLDNDGPPAIATGDRNGASRTGTLAGPLSASDQILDAMAACPTAAIRWSEGES